MTATDAAVWFRVSTGHQDSDNQVPDVEAFASHHGYAITARYTVSDTRVEERRRRRSTRRRCSRRSMTRTRASSACWSCGRWTASSARRTPRSALRIIRQFRRARLHRRERQGVMAERRPEVQDMLIAFAGWMAQQESSSAQRADQGRAGQAPRRRACRSAARRAARTRASASAAATWPRGSRLEHAGQQERSRDHET